MSNIYLASKPFVLVLLGLSTAGFVAGTIMTEEQKREGMLLFGKALFGEGFDSNLLEEYKDALANAYSGIHDLANHSSLAQRGQIVMSSLPNKSVYKMVFPSSNQTDITDGTVITNLLSGEDSQKQILQALKGNRVKPFDIVGFALELIVVDSTQRKEKVGKTSAGLLSMVAMKGLGVFPSANAKYHLAATITMRRSQLLEIYPNQHGLVCGSHTELDASDNFKDLTSSVGTFKIYVTLWRKEVVQVENIMDKYATRWANNNSLGKNSVQYPISENKEFPRKVNRVSRKGIEPLLNKLRTAAEIFVGDKEPDIKVRIAYSNMFEIKTGNLPEPTDNYVVFLACEDEIIKHKLLNVLGGENFKDHKFEDYKAQLTDTSCHFCQKHFSVSAMANRCKDCAMVVHKSCAAVPEAFGIDLNLTVESGVPFILQTCIEYIEENGKNIEGIYRVSGSIVDIANLQSDFERGMCMSNDQLWINANKNLHNICGVVKKYLRDIPNLLIPREVFTKIKNGWKPTSGEKMTESDIAQNVEGNRTLLNRILSGLPRRNKKILKLIFNHLNGLLQFHETTKMTASNFGTSIGPSIVDTGSELVDAIFGNSVFEAMITNIPNVDIAGEVKI